MKIAADKRGHFVAGLIIALAAIIVALSCGMSLIWSCIIGVATASIAGVLKEVLDTLDPGHTVDILDWLATTLGGFGAAGIVALLRVIAVRLLLILIALTAAGCGSTREQTQHQESQQQTTTKTTTQTTEATVDPQGQKTVKTTEVVSFGQTMSNAEADTQLHERKTLEAPELVGVAQLATAAVGASTGMGWLSSLVNGITGSAGGAAAGTVGLTTVGAAVAQTLKNRRRTKAKNADHEALKRDFDLLVKGTSDFMQANPQQAAALKDAHAKVHDKATKDRVRESRVRQGLA